MVVAKDRTEERVSQFLKKRDLVNSELMRRNQLTNQVPIAMVVRAEADLTSKKR